MKYVLLLISAFTVLSVAHAQKRKTFKINPGERAVDKVPAAEMYSHPQFEKGTVYFRNGKFSLAPMNYNALFGDMQFIDPKGDTLSIADAETIRLVIVGKDTFYYHKGFLKQLGDYGKVSLTNKQYFSFVSRQKLGGFGEPSSGSIDTYDRMTSATHFKELVVKEIWTIARNSEYYFGDAYHNYVAANKKNLLALYPGKEKEVLTYLKDNKVSFDNEQELKTMLTALAVLP